MADTPSSLPRRLSAKSGAASGRETQSHESDDTRTAAALVAVRKLFAAESTSFFIVLGTALFLVVFGLVMVLSSSSVEQYVATHDFFGAFLRQGIFAAVGVPLMLVVSRVPTWAWKKYSWHLLAASMILQLLVFTPWASRSTATATGSTSGRSARSRRSSSSCPSASGSG
ncbi:hypothetical protein GCM10025867_26790 [Frondihabitans sucicola]|uniref:Probable peptidoglycan glycosyltransferase FtsW n=1 Tax=Frondihabitans sucicola TaxID=1268041 RepID=A0ABN6Y3X7_9MICO|nr:hypothetical protein GCM10025867_26790 [Frondihabitans sucicola]